MVQEHLDIEVDGIKNVVCLLEDEHENMLTMKARLQESSKQLDEEIASKRAALDIDTSCYNIQVDWKEFLQKYEVVPASTPFSPLESHRPAREPPQKSQAAIEAESAGNKPGWWCERGA